jgi:CheY-like chemotaxis protein
MGNPASVLLAAEQTLAQSVAGLLRADGYACDTATTVDEVLEMLRRETYDLLIVGVEPSGNQGLRIVREARRLASRLPIIVVTGHPSAEDAKESLALGVTAYLTEPLDPALLLNRVASAVRARRVCRALSHVIEELCACIQDLEAACSGEMETGEYGAGVERCVPPLTVRRLASCVAELVSLSTAQSLPGEGRNLCDLLGCPRWPAHLSAFQDAITVLQETKRRFKSKQLADLRQRLNRHLRAE